MQCDNPFISPLLTDLYQLTMVYGYWKAGRHGVHASFDVLFRKCPFQGEFAIFAGLSDVISLLKNFHFRGERIEAVKQVMPGCEPAFYDWLETLDASKIVVESVPEGTIIFPRVPPMTISGPLAVCQLLETGVLNLVNFATLVATNAARFRLAAGPDKTLIEYGLRRAQGPDGAMSASKYAYLGGFDGTSNVLASVLHGIPCMGTHAHAYVQSFTGLKDLKNRSFLETDDFVQLVLDSRRKLAADEVIPTENTNEGELAAFISYAQAFPDKFLALVDTYDTIRSGVPNFLAVAAAMKEVGKTAVGIRLDSGDLAYLSKKVRAMFEACGPRFKGMLIVASNDIDEQVLYQFRLAGHEINTFGIGTHLVTCKAQPALGGVYKLVAVNAELRIKRSEDPVKTTIPGRKNVFRLLDQSGMPLADLMTLDFEEPPQPGEAVHCWHPFDSLKRMIVQPASVVKLQQQVWPILPGTERFYSLQVVSRLWVNQQLSRMRSDHLRPVNPTPYKVSVSPDLYEELHALLERETNGG